MSEVRLTHEGIKTYEERLEHLKTVRRAEIAEQIKEARAFGDISENAEYDAAKTEQARIEHEIEDIIGIPALDAPLVSAKLGQNIEDISTMLRNAVIIDEDSLDTTTVNIGTVVTVKNLDNGYELEFQLVGSREADPYHNRISNESPVGKALVGHSAGDIVEAATPGGVMRYEIIRISK